MKRRNSVIFDLDGTLALIDHRRHLVEGENKNWPLFYKSCINDKPNKKLIDILSLLFHENKIVIYSGRSDEVRLETMNWLSYYNIPYDTLRMRFEGDFTPDEVLKKSWLDIDYQDKRLIVCVFDDRDKVVKMWRDQGLLCCQVAPGDF